MLIWALTLFGKATNLNMENIKFCETCGKKHNGTYGSGRFCSYSCKQKFSGSKGGQTSKQILGKKCKCEFCGVELETKLALRKHLPFCEKHTHRAAYNNWECNCGKVFRTRKLLQEHKRKCELHKDKKTYIVFKCEFCGLERNTTKEAATKHLKYCKGNPNRIECPSHKHSEETKKRISESMKKHLEKHPDMAGFKLNHSSKESYPEKYFREWLQKEKLFSEREYQVGRYALDFAWPERKIYLEIDGSQHHSDYMIKHDEERTKKLSELGWVCVQRVYWPDYKKLNLKERENFLLKLKNLLI